MSAPESDINISNNFTEVTQPSLTWKIDKNSNRIIGETDGLEAVRQAAEIILNIDRYRWQIFRSYSGNEIKNLIGWSMEEASAAIQKYILDALIVDDRIQGIENFNIKIEKDSLVCDFIILTIYGSFPQEVILND